MINKIKAYAVGGILAVPLLLGLLYFRYSYNNETKRCETYVQNNLVKEIIQDQEEKLGIKHAGVPKIKFSHDLALMAQYNWETNIITLGPRSFGYPTVNCQNLLSLKAALAHELGHYYIDKLNESLRRYKTKYATDEDLERIVKEGIAEYFKRTLNLSSLKVTKFYDRAYSFTKPIIDAYGIIGIDYMVKNPPKSGDNLRDYLDSVLVALKNQEKP